MQPLEATPMPPVPEIDTASLILTVFILLVACLLAWREWSDRAARDPEPSRDDYAHFAGQDARRSTGIVVLVLLALGVAVGSRIPPRLGNQANPQFVGIWLGVFVLIFVLLALAMLDWIALRRYARRQRGQILRERIDILREQARLKKALDEPGNGHGGETLEDLFP